MSQTSLVESSSSGEPSRPAFEGSLRLYPAQEPSSEIGQSFTLKGRHIYETSGNPATPTYHLSTRNTQSGKPWQLAISRVLPSEMRRLSEAPVDNQPFIRYDDDLTLYAGEKMHIPISLGQKPLLVVRGHKRGTVRGSIILEKNHGAYKFWHMIPIRRPLTQAENERIQAQMHRRGYRDSDDWKKELLFSVVQKRSSRESEWTDERKVVVGVEKDGKLNVMRAVESELADLIVACWACKNFVLDKAADGDASEPLAE